MRRSLTIEARISAVEANCDPPRPVMTTRAISARHLYLFSKSAGTLPPFSESLLRTSLCNHMFMEAESFLSPV